MDPFFTDSNVLELDISNIARFYRRVDVWMITYYKLDKKSERLKDIWKQLAEVMDGIVKVAAINC